jgi:hypothetical protein
VSDLLGACIRVRAAAGCNVARYRREEDDFRCATGLENGQAVTEDRLQGFSWLDQQVPVNVVRSTHRFLSAMDEATLTPSGVKSSIVKDLQYNVFNLLKCSFNLLQAF